MNQSLEATPQARLPDGASLASDRLAREDPQGLRAGVFTSTAWSEMIALGRDLTIDALDRAALMPPGPRPDGAVALRADGALPGHGRRCGRGWRELRTFGPRRWDGCPCPTAQDSR